MMLLKIISALLLVTAIAADTISSSKSCYVARENFVILFTSNNPRSGDLVQIVVANRRQALLSQSACTSLPCPKSGTITLTENLSAGSYEARLVRSNGNVLATSASFRVLASGRSCTTGVPATLTPVPPPTSAPTTLAPTLAPTPVTINDLANQQLTKARAVIEGLVQADPRLTPEFIRMGFHDCIHVCDGCIDMTVADNNGLAHPISVLTPVVAQFENATINVSRADIWALASMVGADKADHGSITTPISFTNNWFGRVNCENASTVCKNAKGDTVPCSPTVGPARNMPSVNFDGPSLFKYFTTEYSLTQRQVVALMGAHTVGRLLKTESGIDGPNGWQFFNTILHHEYYHALLGGPTSPNSSIEDMLFNSPTWQRVVDDNTGTSFPNIHRWALGIKTPPLVMLNPDVALVRDLNPTNTDPVTGAVSCPFNNHSESISNQNCGASSTITIAAEFSSSNELWLNEFKAAMDLMLTNGYNRIDCAKPVCQLTLK